MTGAPPAGRRGADRDAHDPVFLRAELTGSPLVAARALIGALLVHDGPEGRRAGRIVEVEAYGGEDDAASHARFGRSPRSAVMYGEPGVAYVYLVYGMHHCLNVVTGPAGHPGAVLIRAVEPVGGLGAMREARALASHGRSRPGRHVPDARLAAGPGLVGSAFGVTRSDTGRDLCDPASTLRLAPMAPGTAVANEAGIVATPRIGIGYAAEPWRSLPWRLVLAGSPALSGPARLRPSTSRPGQPAATT